MSLLEIKDQKCATEFNLFFLNWVVDIWHMKQPYNKASIKHFRPLNLKNMFFLMLLRGSKIQRVTSCNCFLKRKQPKVMVIFVHLHSVLHFLAKL